MIGVRRFSPASPCSPQVVLDAPAHVSIREAIGDLDPIREAMDRLDLYRQLQPSAFTRGHLNAQLRTRTWIGDQEQ
jgi:hypothetical protein